MTTYKKNFLNKVIFRLDFEETSLVAVPSFFQEIRKYFPQKEQQEAVEGLVSVDFKEGGMEQVKREITIWTFSNRSGNKRLQIAPKWAYLEYDKYNHSTELLKDVAITLDRFIDKFSIKIINRIGLRYVNTIKLDETSPLEWKKYINPALLGAMTFVKENDISTSRVMGQIISKEEDADISFNYGIWNADYPNEISRKEFILDFDCYSKLPRDITQSEVSMIAKGFNQSIEKMFEASITNGLRRVLNK